MRRPRLEVADIFHRYGAAWRRANAGHVSLGQLQVMSAIEQCRSAALGGHVERCQDCGHSRIAYNSCRNRHCPKCQGAAARDWLAAREADLLPVGYFHLVFTLPAEIAPIAYQNKAVVYDLLFRTAAETLFPFAARARPAWVVFRRLPRRPPRLSPPPRPPGWPPCGALRHSYSSTVRLSRPPSSPHHSAPLLATPSSPPPLSASPPTPPLLLSPLLPFNPPSISLQPPLLLTIAADPKHLGARIGATAVLHSWGSAMTHHPHVHMIVPGGGISLDGTRWVPCRPGFLLPVRVLSRLFRRLFLAGLAEAHAAGRLAFFGEIEGLRHRRAFAAHLAPLRRKNWFVYAKPPFAGPEAVLAYLARYTHRVAIANSRLVAPRRTRRHLPLQGLSPRRAGAVSHHDARRPTSSSGASCSTSCPRDSTASATTGCSPAPAAKPISRAPGS